MKRGLITLDIIFCIILLPGMMSLFPVGEWLQWHSGYVAAYILWLYAVWLLCRRVLGPLLMQGWRGKLTVAGALFLVGAVTFLMSLTSVDFPRTEVEIGRMELHVRAMWVLLLAVVAYGVPVGMLSRQLQLALTRKEAVQAVENCRSLEVCTVTRCGKCKHSTEKHSTMVYCLIHNKHKDPNDFCNFGDNDF